MKKIVSTSIAAAGAFAVITQYILLVNQTANPLIETTIRFFSYFTILSNSLCMLFFATYAVAANRNSDPITHTERLTALTVYISIVGLVYQLVLRQIWEPVGLQRVVDELLHSVIPVAVLVFWVVYGREYRLSYRKVPKWMLFPLVYLIVILIRGAFSGFYPYPFIDVAALGYTIVMRNAFVVMLLFLFLSFLLVFMNRKFAKHP